MTNLMSPFNRYISNSFEISSYFDQRCKVQKLLTIIFLFYKFHFLLAILVNYLQIQLKLVFTDDLSNDVTSVEFKTLDHDPLKIVDSMHACL